MAETGEHIMGADEFLESTGDLTPHEQIKATQEWAIESLPVDPHMALDALAAVCAARAETSGTAYTFYANVAEAATAAQEIGDFSLEGIQGLKSDLGITGAFKGE